jgi:hypothetical protein
MSANNMQKFFSSAAPTAQRQFQAPVLQQAAATETPEDERRALYEGMKEGGYEARVEDVRGAFERFLSKVPKRAMYAPGEVLISHLVDIDFSDTDAFINNLCGGGTAVLDAMLYLAYGEQADKQSIFTVRPSTFKDQDQVTWFRNMAPRVLVGAIEFFLGKGFMPQLDATKTPLTNNLLKRTLDGLGMSTEADLASTLSSASLQKFPAAVLLLENLGALDKVTQNRIELSPAGTKFMRYFQLAAHFDQGARKDDSAKASRAARNMILTWKWPELSAFHPMSPRNKHGIAKFSAKMSVLAMLALSEPEVEKALAYVRSKDMKSLMRDPNMFTDRDGKLTMPALKDQELVPNEITAEVLKAAVAHP